MLPTKRHVKIIKSVDGIFTPGVNYLKIKETVCRGWILRQILYSSAMVSHDGGTQGGDGVKSAPGVLLVTSNFKSQSYKSADKSSLDKG